MDSSRNTFTKCKNKEEKLDFSLMDSGLCNCIVITQMYSKSVDLQL